MEPSVARLKPYLLTLRAGRTYYWCSCGRSKNQPFCDGSHAGTSFEPLKHVAQVDGEEVLFCACKRTRTPPFCDGAHSNLPGGSPLDDPESERNRAVPFAPVAEDARTLLDGTCYVFSPSRAALQARGSLQYCETISPNLGALHQTQLFFRALPGVTPVVSFGDREVILFVGAGSGAITISGKHFPVSFTDGVYVRPGEAFQLESDTSLELFVTVSPAADIQWLDEMPGNFAETYAKRVVPVDAAQRTAMGPRYFQCLVDKTIGSKVITQFIGHIPQSKAAPHRHLYEESLIILSGAGCMWTENRKTLVGAGDVIFLPRKQEHSLQSLTANGLDVVGVICPDDNPSINY